MQVMGVGGAAFAMEREIEGAEAVTDGHEGRRERERIEKEMARAVGLPEDFILGEESGEGGHARDGKAGDKIGDPDDRKFFAEAAHEEKVLLAVKGMNHRARAEEQASLEESVGEKVEHAGGDAQQRSRSQTEEHVAELADRGIGEHALEVVLRKRDQGRHQCREAADQRHHELRLGRRHEQRAEPGDHVHPAGDHRRGVNQRAYRGRAFHRVGKPDVQRELRALAAGPHEQEQADRHCQAGRTSRCPRP